MDANQSARNPAEAGARIAAIDVGSNSIRLVVAEVLTTGGYRVLDEERENTRLAASMTETHRLDPTAAEASVTVLRNFCPYRDRLRREPDSRNRHQCAARCRRRPRVLRPRPQGAAPPIEVISAEEEARLAFLSVARAFDISGREVAVADIGGGSTEIVLASSGLVDQVYATKLGAVRVTETCGVAGASTEKQVAKLRRYVDRTLRKQVGKPPFVPDMLFGTGGTFTALASIMMARQGQAGQPMWGFRVTRAQIRHLVADLAPMSLEKRCKVAGLSPQRADIIVAGLAIVERVMRYLRVNVVQVHTRGVRDGLLLTMVQQAGAGQLRRPRNAAPRSRSSPRTAGVDLSHARQVARIAGSLWEQLAEPLGLVPEDRELIESAALVANVGYLINFEGHHKHSYHLIRNSELPGFERRQVAAAGERGPLSPRFAAQAEARKLPRTVGGRSAPRGGAGGHPAAGPGAGSHASAACGRSAGPRHGRRCHHQCAVPRRCGC